MAVTGGIIAAAGSVGSGLLTSGAAKSAGSAAQSYLSQALNFEKGVYSDATTNLSPWISGGQAALSQYEGGLGLGTGGTGSSNLQSYWDAFTKTPYYTFPLKQYDISAGQTQAATGLNLTSGQIANLGQYGANYAGTQWGNYMTALNNLSGLGQTASTNLGTIGSNISQQVAGTSNQQASTAINSIMASAGGTSQAINSLGSLSNALGSAFGSGTGSGYGSGSSNLASNSPLWSSIFGGGGGGNVVGLA